MKEISQLGIMQQTTKGRISNDQVVVSICNFFEIGRGALDNQGITYRIARLHFFALAGATLSKSRMGTLERLDSNRLPRILPPLIPFNNSFRTGNPVTTS